MRPCLLVIWNKWRFLINRLVWQMQEYLWNIAMQPSVSCYNIWANSCCSGCSPLGEKSLWNGTVGWSCSSSTKIHLKFKTFASSDKFLNIVFSQKPISVPVLCISICTHTHTHTYTPERDGHHACWYQNIYWYQGAVSIRKTVLPGMAIPMLKIRRPNGRLIFNMEIAIRR